jgi:hypothetical protein
VTVQLSQSWRSPAVPAPTRDSATAPVPRIMSCFTYVAIFLGICPGFTGRALRPCGHYRDCSQ